MALAPAARKQSSLRPHPRLYEINTWAWLEQLSARLGRVTQLGSVPDSEWDSLADLGFDVVWLMGVWKRSPESRRIALADRANLPLYDLALPNWTLSDVIGSPYAVAQYAPDPRIGTWDDVDRIREKLLARGIRLFLDFVGNHTALDHPWTREHPEFYVQGTKQDFEKDPPSFYAAETAKGPAFLALAKDPYFPPWRDAAQLNHFHPGMRAAQLADMRTIASHCDGVRCDMAMLQLSDIFERLWGHLLSGLKPPEKEFWTEAHASVPDLILLAEAYWGTELRLLNLGFSFVYDKGLYDAVLGGKTEEIRWRLSTDVTWQERYARFLENHDEKRAVAAFGKQRLPGVGTLMATVPGMRFYHQGELTGCEVQVPITLRMPAEVPPDPELSKLFETILSVTNEDIFHCGQWSLLQVTPEGDSTSASLVAYQWRTETARKVVVVNLAGSASQGRVQLGDAALPGRDYIFYDQLHAVRYPRDAQEVHEHGLFVRLPDYQAHLFDVTLAE
jgi:Alpha amylase, catalytic domain